jgi:adenosylcobinamide kinase/adenosylcobinamide-phosphate guanylyltransferase
MTGIARKEFVIGGQRSGKSRRAESLARTWLDGSPEHRAVLLATAQPWDEEMRERIARHQADRAERVPGMQTLEVPLALGEAIQRLSQPDTLIVVDCLTLWLTNLRMPLGDGDSSAMGEAIDLVPTEALLAAITGASGPLVIVGNEIGLGVIPMGAQVRAFVDALGRLNQAVASRCDRVCLMVAGQPLFVKGG